MPKYQVVGDLHLSDRAPAMCTDSYQDDLFDLLEQTVALEEEKGCLGTIWAGDVFHIKSPNRNSHALVQKTIELTKKYRKLWIVAGNHDLTADRLESVMTTQPLGVLIRSGIDLLEGWEPTGEHPIYGVPWLQRFTPETVKETFYAWQTDAKWPKKLAVAHAPLYPPGQELEWEYYPTQGENGWAEAMKSGHIYYGHVHESHGIYKVGDVTFANHGALSRGSLSEATIKREITSTIWDTETGFEAVRLDYKPASEVFRMADKEAKVTAQVQLDDFLSNIGQTRISITTIASVMEHIRVLDLGPELENLIQQLLEETEK